MNKATKTADRLLAAAQDGFWTKGYGNVSLREIAAEAGADVALISRYFGSKKGLFQATLDNAFNWPEILDPANDPVDVAIAKYTDPEKAEAHMTAMRMIMANAGDEEVGDLVRAAFAAKLLQPLQERLGGPAASQRLAMFIAVLVGASVGKQCLGLPGLSDSDANTYRAQLHHLVDAALSFDGTGGG